MITVVEHMPVGTIGFEARGKVTGAMWADAKAVSWMVSEEVRVFDSDDVRDAKIWLVGIDD